MTAANNPENNDNNHKNKKIQFEGELNDVEKADVAKLHNEVNQLRNHELLVNSFAIAMVVVALPALKDNILLSIAMLISLIAIHYWQYTLLDIRTRITTYLVYHKISSWEKDYRTFSNNNPRPSMRGASRLLFIALGFVAALAPLCNYSLDLFINNLFSNTKFIVIFVIYACIILLLGWILSLTHKKQSDTGSSSQQCKCKNVIDSYKNMPTYIRHIITKYTCEWCKIYIEETGKTCKNS